VKPWFIALIAAVCLVAFVALLTMYGNSRYDNGVSDTKATQATDNAKANDDGRKSLEQNQIKARSISDTDLDNALRDIGMLRN
jgi:hypothetical protein